MSNMCKLYRWKIVYTSLNDGVIYEVKFTHKDEVKSYIEELMLVGAIDTPEDVFIINLFEKKIV